MINQAGTEEMFVMTLTAQAEDKTVHAFQPSLAPDGNSHKGVAKTG